MTERRGRCRSMGGAMEEADRSSLDPLEKFERRCPPGGEQRVVLYFTSLRGIRKTFENCRRMKHTLEALRFKVDERDVAMHADFRRELNELLKSNAGGKPVPLPRLFIKGRYIGGPEEVSLLHEDGILRKLLQTLPTRTSCEQCAGCGGFRFLPCSRCRGSCKLLVGDNLVARCPACNENGLTRCPLCF